MKILGLLRSESTSHTSRTTASLFQAGSLFTSHRSPPVNAQKRAVPIQFRFGDETQQQKLGQPTTQQPGGCNCIWYLPIAILT